MTQAIAARRDGDAFQARLFWLKAAKLLDNDSSVVRVGFEHGPKGFDDIWVEYDPARLLQDQFGAPLRKEYFQCKWHVAPGTYTHLDLTKPEFISATTHSLLQRAYAALEKENAEKGGVRFNLITNWQLDKADRLSQLLRNRSHTLKIDEFFEGTTRQSKTFLIRQLWREHLSIDDTRLRKLVASLGLPFFGQSLDSMREWLDLTFKAYGLARVPVESSVVTYDDRIRQWAAQGRNVFDRQSFRDACAQENLFEEPKRKSIVFGVKSFEHPIDRLEDRCDEVLNLVPAFDERLIRDSASWRDTLFPDLRRFLGKAALSGDRLRLAIDTHLTLAFAAGTVLNTKSGRIVEIEQRSPIPVVWAPDDNEPAPAWPQWETAVHEANPAASEVAIGICLTHDVEPRVRSYLARLPDVIDTLIFFRPGGGPSPRAVLGGAHAFTLAEQLAAKIKNLRESGQAFSSHARIHLFIAAPNGFVFYLGRQFQSLKPLTLYEFDFENQAGGSYAPSLSIPDLAGYAAALAQ